VYSQQQPLSHQNVYTPLNNTGSATNVVNTCSSIAMDPHRKISIMSNQSTMSTDSDYVSDTSNLQYFEGKTRKLSDGQGLSEVPSGVEMFHYTKPASCNLNLNLASVYSAAKMNVKDQSCQTPELPLDGGAINNTNIFQGTQTTLPSCEHESFDDPKRKISNISTISTLSSLSTESASTFDTVTMGAETFTFEDASSVRDEECNVRRLDEAVLPQVRETVYTYIEFFETKLSYYVDEKERVSMKEFFDWVAINGSI